MTSRALTVLICTSLLPLAGCLEEVSIAYHRDQPRRVVVYDEPEVVVHHAPPVVIVREEIHSHGYDCGHVYNGGAWIRLSRSHNHGSNCGHNFRGGRWLTVKIGSKIKIGSRKRNRGKAPIKVKVRPKKSKRFKTAMHIHNRKCGCVWDGMKYLTASAGHLHGRGCGHVLRAGRWSIEF